MLPNKISIIYYIYFCFCCKMFIVCVYCLKLKCSIKAGDSIFDSEKIKKQNYYNNEYRYLAKYKIIIAFCFEIYFYLLSTMRF